MYKLISTMNISSKDTTCHYTVVIRTFNIITKRTLLKVINNIQEVHKIDKITQSRYTITTKCDEYARDMLVEHIMNTNYTSLKLLVLM